LLAEEFKRLGVQPLLDALDVPVAAEQALVVEFLEGAFDADKDEAGGVGFFREAALQAALRPVEFNEDSLVALLLLFLAAKRRGSEGFSHLEKVSG